jgi:hypothetical protein
VAQHRPPTIRAHPPGRNFHCRTTLSRAIPLADTRDPPHLPLKPSKSPLALSSCPARARGKNPQSLVPSPRRHAAVPTHHPRCPSSLQRQRAWPPSTSPPLSGAQRGRRPPQRQRPESPVDILNFALTEAPRRHPRALLNAGYTLLPPPPKVLCFPLLLHCLVLARLEMFRKVTV